MKKKPLVTGVVRLYDDDTVINKVVEQLFIGCDKVVVVLTGPCSESSIAKPLQEKVSFIEDKRFFSSNSMSLQRIVDYFKSDPPDYLVYPDQDEILPAQWPSCINYLERCEKLLTCSFKFLTCWESIDTVLPTKCSYPLHHHCKISKWYKGIRFLPGQGYCFPSHMPQKARHRSCWSIRHTALMTARHREKFWSDEKRKAWRSNNRWKNSNFYKDLYSAIVFGVPKGVVPFEPNKKWQEYPRQ